MGPLNGSVVRSDMSESRFFFFIYFPPLRFCSCRTATYLPPFAFPLLLIHDSSPPFSASYPPPLLNPSLEFSFSLFGCRYSLPGPARSAWPVELAGFPPPLRDGRPPFKVFEVPNFLPRSSPSERVGFRPLPFSRLFSLRPVPPTFPTTLAFFLP